MLPDSIDYECNYYSPYPAVPIVGVRVLVDRNAAVAEIIYTAPQSGTVKVTGSSKREPGDVYVAQIGEQLAVARALRNLASELEAEAREEVRLMSGEED